MSLTKIVLLIATISYFACSNPQAKVSADAQQDKTNEPTLAEVKPAKVEEKALQPGHDKQPAVVMQAKDRAVVEADVPTDAYVKKKAQARPVAAKSQTKGESPPVKVEVEAPKKEDISKKEEKSQAVDVTSAPKQEGVSHEAWNKLLQQNVSATGKVNYQAIKRNVSALNDYLDELAQNPVQSSWSRAEQMAYWINAYNAFTVKLIVDNYPVKSIMDLHGGKPWEVKWIKLGGKTYSLNQIENDILRPKYKDARIHFAVNCAAKSCPPLLNKAWTAANLTSNLDGQARKFINNSQYNQLSANGVKISKIFEWYASDFGNIIEYLNQYSTTKVSTDATVSYNEYNWSLNNGS